MTDGYSPEADAEAYRQQIAVDVFHSLVHGMRIHVDNGMSPNATAQRVIDIHAKLMLYATQAGIIPEEGKARD